MSAVRRHPIITFFVLAYAISWGFLPIEAVRFLPSGPLFAALIVIPLTQGWAGLKELGFRMIRWRVRWYWYALALGLPLAVHLLSRGAQRRDRGGRPVADLQLLDHLPHGVRDAPGQPRRRAAGRASGLERVRPARAAGLRLLAASGHHDPGAARGRLAPAHLLPGRGRLAAVRRRGRPRDDDGGDVLVRRGSSTTPVAACSWSSWRTTSKGASSTSSAGSIWACGARWRSGWSSSTGRPGAVLRQRPRPCNRRMRVRAE